MYHTNAPGSSDRVPITTVGARATFGPMFPIDGLLGDVVAAHPASGCIRYTNADEVAGRITIVDDSLCSIEEKARMAQQAGAIALIVINNENSDLPTAVPDYGAGSQVSIPVVLIEHVPGASLQSFANFNPVCPNK
jgi:hypothetical protein